MRKMTLVLTLCPLLWLVSLARAQEAVATIELGGGKTAQVTFTTVDVPGAVVTSVKGINATGQMVGVYGASNLGPDHGFLLDGGNFTTIDYPAAETTVATGINDSGLIVGYAEFSGGLIVHGFLYDMQSFTQFDVPGVPETYPYGINNAGQVVGTAGSSGSRTRAFEMSGGQFVFFNWPGSYADKLAANINNLGEIVGFLAGGVNADKGLAYKAGRSKSIAFPGAQSTYAWGVNDSGLIVGYYVIGTTVSGFTLLNRQYLPLNFPGAKATFPRGINGLGQVVGEYTSDFIGYHGFVTSPLPRVR